MTIRQTIAHKLIDAIEAKTGQSMDYLRLVNQASPPAIWKFFFFVPLSVHGQEQAAEILAMGRIAACRQEDCGTCLQIVIDDALSRNVDPTLVAAAARNDPAALGEVTGLAYRFATADPSADELRRELGKHLSQRTMTELALAIATARVFPSLKRGLGYATACTILDLPMTQAADGPY